MHSSVEVSYFQPESEARMAIQDPVAYIAEFIAPGQLVIMYRGGSWQPDHRSSATLEGNLENEGDSKDIQLVMSFPGMIRRGLAKARHREPSAIMHLTME